MTTLGSFSALTVRRSPSHYRKPPRLKMEKFISLVVAAHSASLT